MVSVTPSELASQYWEPQSIGPVAQVDLSTWSGLSPTGVPGATIGAGSNYTSGVIQANGFKSIAVGAKSTQVGAITIQRFMDAAGLVPIGALVSASLVASTSQWATVNDGLPFRSFQFSITNTSGSSATLSNFAAILSAN